MEIIVQILRVANWLYYHDAATLTILMSFLAIALIAYGIQRRITHG